MEQNRVERAVQIEIDTEKRIKGVGKPGWFTSTDINRNVPTTLR